MYCFFLRGKWVSFIGFVVNLGFCSIQKEIEDLRTRLAILEGKDQQLRREIEEQDRLIQSQDSELAALLGCISLRELQEISKAVDDTLASSYRIPLSLDLPEAIKRYLNFNLDVESCIFLCVLLNWLSVAFFIPVPTNYLDLGNLKLSKERCWSSNIDVLPQKSL